MGSESGKLGREAGSIRNRTQRSASLKDLACTHLRRNPMARMKHLDRSLLKCNRMRTRGTLLAENNTC